MLAKLKHLLAPSPLRTRAYALYTALVNEARHPSLYEAAIPDTLDGRFDAIVLHLSLLTVRLEELSPRARGRLLQALDEAFIADMDRSLREMGVGDTGVGRRIRRMAEALLGRRTAYMQAGVDEAAWREALWRNVHRGAEGAQPQAAQLAAYALTFHDLLKRAPLEALLNTPMNSLPEIGRQARASALGGVAKLSDSARVAS